MTSSPSPDAAWRDIYSLTPEQIKSDPVWASDVIVSLRAQLAEKKKELEAAQFRVAALREGLQEADSFPDVGGTAKVSIKNALLCDDDRAKSDEQYYTLKGLRSINYAYSERLTQLEQQLEAIRKQTVEECFHSVRRLSYENNRTDYNNAIRAALRKISAISHTTAEEESK